MLNNSYHHAICIFLYFTWKTTFKCYLKLGKIDFWIKKCHWLEQFAVAPSNGYKMCLKFYMTSAYTRSESSQINAIPQLNFPVTCVTRYWMDGFSVSLSEYDGRDWPSVRVLFYWNWLETILVVSVCLEYGSGDYLNLHGLCGPKRLLLSCIVWCSMSDCSTVQYSRWKWVSPRGLG